MGSPFGPPGFTGGGYTDPLTGEFQPGVTVPGGPTTPWTRAIRISMSGSSGDDATMRGSRGRVPTMSGATGSGAGMVPNG